MKKKSKKAVTSDTVTSEIDALLRKYGVTEYVVGFVFVDGVTVSFSGLHLHSLIGLASITKTRIESELNLINRE